VQVQVQVQVPERRPVQLPELAPVPGRVRMHSPADRIP